MDTESAESGDQSSYEKSDTPTQPWKQSPKRKGKASASTRKRRRGDDPEDRSDSAPESSPSKKNRRKRKHIRLKGHYSDQYRQLLNEVIQDANNAPHASYLSDRESSDKLETSQIGISIWTSEQKNALFCAVERYGRDDLPRLAAVTEKSEQEVVQYLQLLRDGLLEYATIPEGGLKSQAGKLPAAAELSEECCNALDQSAEALSWYQESWDIKQEKKQHGDYWLLNREVANKVEQHFSADEDSITGSESESESASGASANDSTSLLSKISILEAIPAAKLLNLSKFLDLSERIFMNSKEPDKNWRTYQDPPPLRTSGKQVPSPEESPAIFHTTFNDLHRLIISLTKRLVHVAIFQATARLRATDSLTRKLLHKPSVQRRDVLTALRVTGVKEDSIEYWAKLPSRSRHDWMYQENTTIRSEMITVHSQEAERWLSLPLKRVRPTDEGTGLESAIRGGGNVEENKVEAPGVDDLHRDKEKVEEMILPIDSQDDYHTDSDNDLTDDELTDNSLTKLENANDCYFELVDTKRSRREEHELWQLLGLQKPPTVDLKPVQIPPEPERAPLVGYGSPQEEWRDWTERVAEWEIMGPSDLSSEGESEDIEESEESEGSRETDRSSSQETNEETGDSESESEKSSGGESTAELTAESTAVSIGSE